MPDAACALNDSSLNTIVQYDGKAARAVGAVILADHLHHGKRREGLDAFDLATIPDFRTTPLIAWAIGAAVALWSNYQAPPSCRWSSWDSS